MSEKLKELVLEWARMVYDRPEYIQQPSPLKNPCTMDELREWQEAEKAHQTRKDEIFHHCNDTDKMLLSISNRIGYAPEGTIIEVAGYYFARDNKVWREVSPTERTKYGLRNIHLELWENR